MSTLTSAQDLDSYLKNMYGVKYRRVPTVIYGSCDVFVKHLKFTYYEYESTGRKSMREPPCRLGVHTKIYVGCTFKTVRDF